MYGLELKKFCKCSLNMHMCCQCFGAWAVLKSDTPGEVMSRLLAVLRLCVFVCRSLCVFVCGCVCLAGFLRLVLLLRAMSRTQRSGVKGINI